MGKTIETERLEVAYGWGWDWEELQMSTRFLLGGWQSCTKISGDYGKFRKYTE